MDNMDEEMAKQLAKEMEAMERMQRMEIRRQQDAELERMERRRQREEERRHLHEM